MSATPCAPGMGDQPVRSWSTSSVADWPAKTAAFALVLTTGSLGGMTTSSLLPLRRHVVPLETTESWVSHPQAKPVETQSSASTLLELRRLTGLTWDQLAKLFDVSRRSVFLWASGKPMSAENVELLARVIAFVRYLDRGSASTNRDLLLSGLADGTILFDRLSAGDFAELRALVEQGPGRRTLRLGPLSPAARRERTPPPPDQLLGALQDRPHVERGPHPSMKPMPLGRRG